jgi:glycosyltransferase involved in cell wall biosynthesis
MMSRPKVSIVIPNYNKAQFLEKRLTSIVNQTYHDFEIIIVDDASTDDSRPLLQQFAAVEPRCTQVVLAEQNGGIFVTWNRGIRLAQGEYVWIAESDDYADPRLLARLVGEMEAQPNIGLAYCQSWIVDEHDQLLGQHTEHTILQLPYWDPQRWQTDFITAGRTECARYLIYRNTIPNASAVVFRRALYDLTGGADEQLKVNGDWIFWTTILLHTDLAFIAEPLNYFRTHSATMRSVYRVTGRNIEESFYVLQRLLPQLHLTAEEQRQVVALNLDAWMLATLTYRIPWARQRAIYTMLHTLVAHPWPLLFKHLVAAFLTKTVAPRLAPLRKRLQLKTRVKQIYQLTRLKKG